jgi:RNA polymerase sigma factor (TIGR02999 family)
VPTEPGPDPVTPAGDAKTTVTGLLRAWRDGDGTAVDRLVPLVYDELHRLADRFMRRERADHTLQATALVNEAFLRLVDADVPWEDRAHFLAVAARTMRRVLVDYARARGRAKRGGEMEKVSLERAAVVDPAHLPDLVELDEALERLAAQDERKARAIELHYFGGLSYEETAKVLDVSPVTVHRDLRLAKAWLYSHLR